MSVKWTEQQKDAIDSRNGAILVSAAAGSGKTAVLVERVSQRITDPDNRCDADRLLVVTYTTAAASEMKERIMHKIDELISLNEGDISYLKRQKLLLNRAHISTVHSFCSDLIRENFYNLDISRDFRIGDDKELLLLKNEALEWTLDTLYSEGFEDFKKAADCFSSSRDDKGFREIIKGLYVFLCSHPFPNIWLDEKLSMYNINDLKESVWYKYLIDYSRGILSFCKDKAEEAIKVCKSTPLLNFTRDNTGIYDQKKIGKLKLLPPLELLLSYQAFLKELEIAFTVGWDEVCALMLKFDKGRIYSSKEFNTTAEYQKALENKNAVADALKELVSIFNRKASECMEDIREDYIVIKELFRAVKLYGDKFSEYKREKNLLDFNDLEHLTLKLLVKCDDNGKITYTELAKEVSRRYDEVMVDEYQDANEVQDMIFSALSDSGRKLFTVGDVKQSIYRFRQAMPEIFMKRSCEYEIYDKKCDNYPGKIILSKNFRSRGGILSAVNFVFRALMSKELGEMEYTKDEELKLGASYPESEAPCVEYKLIETAQTEDDIDIIEARQIALLIREEMKNSVVTDKNSNTSKPQFSDFCILLRNSSKHAPVFVNELNKCGIPAMADAKSSFFDRREISIALSLLRVIDNPIQDISLLSVMLSPIYGFTPDELAKYRVEVPHGNIYSVITKCAEHDKKCADFLNELEQYRIKACAMPCDELINFIYNKTSLKALVAAMENGDNRIKNLNLLREYASEYESGAFKGLNSFIRFLDRLIENGEDLSSASRTQESESNAVRVMSIHSSKGLEFPICIIANLSREFVLDKNENMLIHPQMGIGFRHSKTLPYCKYNTIARKAIAESLDISQKSEELRVLYVAMTRAKEKLIFIQSKKNIPQYLEKKAKSLSNTSKIPPYIAKKANCIGDWLINCLLLHPDGDVLRKTVENDITPLPRDEYYSKWDAKIIDAADIEVDEKEESIPKIEYSNVDLELYERLKHRFEFEYQWADEALSPVKYSVSELVKGSRDIGEDEFLLSEKPLFLSDEQMSAAQRGTSLHLFMEHADFHHASMDLHSELARLVEHGYISQQQSEVVPLEKVKAFFESNIGKRIALSDKLYREYRFAFLEDINALGIDTLPYSSEKTVIQGAIDCAFEENGEIIIVDYKTDRVKSLDQLTQRYSNQLKLYKRAMEECTGKKVSQLWIYSFNLNCAVEVK